MWQTTAEGKKDAINVVNHIAGLCVRQRRLNVQTDVATTQQTVNVVQDTNKRKKS